MAEEEKKGQEAGSLESNYSGQYKVSEGIGRKLDGLWQKYHPDGNDDTVKAAIESFFLILDQDIRNETNLQDLRMPLIDAAEFKAVCILLNSLLKNYVKLEVEDETGSTVIDRKTLTDKIISTLKDFKEKLINKLLGDKKNSIEGEIGENLKRDNLTEKLLKPLSNFFKTIGQVGAEAKAKKLINKENVNKFVTQLKQLIGDNTSISKRFENLSKSTNHFKDLKKRIRNIAKSANIGNTSKSITSIKNTLNDSGFLNIGKIDSVCSQLYSNMRKTQLMFDTSILPEINKINSLGVDTFGHADDAIMRRTAIFGHVGRLSQKILFPTIVKAIRQYGGLIFEKIILDTGRTNSKFVSIIDWCQGVMIKWLNFKNLIKSKFDKFKRNHKILWESIKRISLAVKQLKEQLKTFLGWAFGGIKTIIKKSYRIISGVIKSTAGKVIGSIKSIISKVSFTIFHPIQTLKNISESSIFKSLLIAFSSPSAANTLGFFCGFMFGIFKKLIFDKLFPQNIPSFGAIIKRFVFIPVLTVVNNAVKVVNFSLEIVNYIFDFIKDNFLANIVIKSTLGLVNGSLNVGTWLAQIAMGLFGFKFENESTRILTAQGLATAFSTYIKIKTRPILNGMWSNGGILGKILGAGFASMMNSPSPFETDSDDKDGKVETINIKMVKNVNENEFSEYQTSKNMRQAMIKGGTYDEDRFNAADDVMRNINRERFEIRDSLYQLDDILKHGGGIPEELVQSMTNTFIDKDKKKMRQLLDFISETQYRSKFSDLDEMSQIGAMQIFLRARLYSVNNMLSRYNFAKDDPKLMDDAIDAANHMFDNFNEIISKGKNLSILSHGISYGSSDEIVQMNQISNNQDVDKLTRDIIQNTWSSDKRSERFKKFLENKIKNKDESVKGMSVRLMRDETKPYDKPIYSEGIYTHGIDQERIKSLAKEFLISEISSQGINDTQVIRKGNNALSLNPITGLYEENRSINQDNLESVPIQSKEYLKLVENNQSYKDMIKNINCKEIKKQNKKLETSVDKFKSENKDTLQWMNDTLFPWLMQVMPKETGLPDDLAGDSN